MSEQGRKIETTIVNGLYDSIKKTSLYDLMRIERRVPLKSRGLGEIFESWHRFKVPFEPEIDLALVFRDVNKIVDDALIIAVEVKYFSGEIQGKRSKRRFSSGLGQAMSYGSMGVDGISLWHIFSETVDDDTIKRYFWAMNEVLTVFDIPLLYCSMRQKADANFQGCTGQSFFETTPSQMASRTRDYFTSEKGMNRLFFPPRVQRRNTHDQSRIRDIMKRRGALKTILKIPV